MRCDLSRPSQHRSCRPPVNKSPEFSRNTVVKCSNFTTPGAPVSAPLLISPRPRTSICSISPHCSLARQEFFLLGKAKAEAKKERKKKGNNSLRSLPRSHVFPFLYMLCLRPRSFVRSTTSCSRVCNTRSGLNRF